MKRLWDRLLTWGLRQRRDALLRIELQGSLDSPVERIVTHRDTVVVFTRYCVYTISYNYSHGGLEYRRVG